MTENYAKNKIYLIIISVQSHEMERFHFSRYYKSQIGLQKLPKIWQRKQQQLQLAVFLK